MNWETIKTSKDASVLDGITVEVDKTDSSFRSITLLDKSGSKLRVRIDSYNLYIDVPAKPKTEKRWAVKGEYRGLPVDETFEDKYEATQRRNEIDYGNEAITVSEVEVEIPF